MNTICTVLLIISAPLGLFAFKSIQDELLGNISPTNLIPVFQQWMDLNSVVYNNMLTTWTKFKVFKDNVKRVFELNKKYNGLASFALTRFADLTTEEFTKTYLRPEMSKLLKKPVKKQVKNKASILTAKASKEFDWTKKNVVTGVKNQGEVGTCYIFSSLAMIESRWAIKGKPLANLSAEQVADCLAVYDGQLSESVACGINGGEPSSVFQYIRQIGGIESEEDYPYCIGTEQCRPCEPKGYNPSVCGTYPIENCLAADSCDTKLDTTKFVKGLKVDSWYILPQDEDIIATLLEQEGPLVGAVDAIDLQFYRMGVLMPDRCEPYNINHAVLLVGFGTENGVPFWRAKNSWGVKFGEEGYFRIVRGVEACGIDSYVTSVTLE